MAVQPQVSPVGGSGVFKTKLQRNVVLLGVGAAAIGMLGFGINGAMNEAPLDDKPVDTGSTSISQVTMSPPEIVKPDTPPVPPPRAPDVVKPKDTPPDVVKPVDAPAFVRFPKGGAEASFDVPPPLPREDRAAGLAQRVTAKDTATEAGRTNVLFKPSTLMGGKAGRAIRLDYVMMPQNIECITDTAMDSTFAGALLCHTAHDVLSPAHVMLMPAGTPVVGTYKNDIKNGQTRIYSFAGSAMTPEGIPVPLDSQMGDGLGRNGVPGEVDNHNGERFGASLALTAAQSGVSIAQSALSAGGNSYFNLNQGSGGGPQELATEILRKQIDIAPTITVPPGSIVSIIVDHFISFDDVIKVRTTEGTHDLSAR